MALHRGSSSPPEPHSPQRAAGASNHQCYFQRNKTLTCPHLLCQLVCLFPDVSSLKYSPNQFFTFLLIFMQLCWIYSIKLNSVDGRVHLTFSLFSEDIIIFPIIWGYCFARILMSSFSAGVTIASFFLQPPNSFELTWKPSPISWLISSGFESHSLFCAIVVNLALPSVHFLGPCYW